jgi:hypothetical protein
MQRLVRNLAMSRADARLATEAGAEVPCRRGGSVSESCPWSHSRQLVERRPEGIFVAHVAQMSGGNAPANAVNSTDFGLVQAGSGPGGRRFKSFRPDHISPLDSTI